MLKLLKNLKSIDWVYISVGVVLIAMQVWLDMTLPDYMSTITTLIVSEGSAMGDILAAGGKMLLCAFGSAALAVAVGFLTARIAADFSYAVREKTFNKIADFGTFEMKKFSVPSLITRTTNDITQIQMVLALGLQVMIKSPILAVWAIIKILGKSWQLSVVVAAAVALLVIEIVVLIIVVMPKFRIIQKQVDDVNRVTDENLPGLRVVRAFNAERYQEDKFEDVNVRLMRTQLFTMRALAILMPLLSLVMSALSLAIYNVGAHLVNNIAVPADPTLMMAAVAQRAQLFGDVVVFSTYALFVVMSFMLLAAIFMFLPRAQVSAGRINEVLCEPIRVQEGSGAGDTGLHGTLEFRDVSFRFPGSGADFMEHISFKAEQGQTVAIVGATGSGKTTLVNLAARLYDATEGEILLDGVNIRDYSFEELYRRVGYIAQKAVLFSDTIRGNVLFGQEAEAVSDDAVLDALSIAQASGFVGKMERSLESPIAQGGSNVSGGQKQRLSIARAIARRPEILIFDDSFSALDFQTDRRLREALRERLPGVTRLVVASRIGTIRNADCILVLNDGQLAGAGTHDELMKNCEIYREIASSQLSRDELGA